MFFQIKRRDFQKTDCKNGFSLVEILIVIVVLLILFSLALPAFRIFQKELDLNNSTEEIVSGLRTARNKTIASEGGSQYGVYFDNTVFPDQFIIFKGSSYATRDFNSDEIHQLAKAVELFEINLGGGFETVFERLTGNSEVSGNVRIRLADNPSENKTVYIESSGLASLIAPAVPSGGRVEDSRHVHFLLGWSIQNATSVKFYFPVASQTETVDVTSNFSIDKTSFDWSGTFSVSGQDQVFNLHTHSLDAANTLLSVNRDRNPDKTNQEVIIYIVDGGVDKEIAHYLGNAADEVNVGVFGGTMEVQ